MSARFYLHRRSDTGREKSLRLIVSRGNRKIPVTTTVTVKASDWSQSMQRVRSNVPGAADLNGALDRLRNAANALALEHPDDDDLKAALLERLGRAPKEAEPTLLEHFDAFVAYKKQRVKASTIQVYEALREHFEAFLDGARLTGSDVGRGFLEDFQTHLTGAKVVNSTANKYVSRLKTFMRWLHERGHIEAVPPVKPLKTVQSTVVRLDLDELARLQNVDLSGDGQGHQQARDLFLLCTFTGQRVSDVKRMRWEDLKDGAWFVHVQKTGVHQRIPLMTPALEIIERYRDTARPVPRISEQRCNDYLKEIARKAKITAPVTIRHQRGGKLETETLPKHEVLSTHAGRRTFVSLLLESGVAAKEMLGVTHNDLRSLRQYAGASEPHLLKGMTSVFENGKTETG